ncbi:MAG: ATP-binding protein [Algicola sp.]|nr:ATP-binding protein [Algicola sp.]
MTMNRLAEQALLDWLHSSGRKPLLIDGARQVGKSYLVERLFGPAHFKRVLKLDFMEKPALRVIFDGDLTPDVLLREIQLVTGQRFDVEHDLLFFEEIGLCQKAIDSLKYFCQQRPDIALVATGSNVGLLGSFPVGKVNRVTIRPMTFKEFLWANDLSLLAEVLDEPSRRQVSPLIHDKLWQQFLDYLFVGGMPEAVAKWVSHDQNIDILKAAKAVSRVHKTLLGDYKDDFAKYSQGQSYSALQITRVFDSITTNLMKERDGAAPKYKFRGILPGNRGYEDLIGPIHFLETIGVAHRVYIVEGNVRSPLRAMMDETRFKLLLHDVGLLNATLGLGYAEVINQAYDFKGYVCENFVACEFIAAMHDKQDQALYSWVSKRAAELEFIIEGSDNQLIPIEVKSGRSTRSKSLSTYVKQYTPQKAYKLTGRLSDAPREGVVKELPLYMAASVIGD